MNICVGLRTSVHNCCRALCLAQIMSCPIFSDLGCGIVVKILSSPSGVHGHIRPCFGEIVLTILSLKGVHVLNPDDMEIVGFVFLEQDQLFLIMDLQISNKKSTWFVEVVVFTYFGD